MDDRIVVNPKLNPFRKICALRIKAKNKNMYVGTGWFISAHVLATAGHCVFMHDAGGWVSEVEVLPFLDGDEKSTQKYRSTKFHSFEGWVLYWNSDCDYGVIELNDPVGDTTGFFSFASYEDKNIINQNLNLSGYPLDRYSAIKQLWHGRQIVRASNRKIYYDIDTFGGQSGCPVWLQLKNEERVAVAIHAYGGTLINHGIRINDFVYDNLMTWKNKLKPK